MWSFFEKIPGPKYGFLHFWQMAFLNSKLVILTLQKSIEKSLYNGQKWSDFHFFDYFGNISLLVTFSEKTNFFTNFRFFFLQPKHVFCGFLMNEMAKIRVKCRKNPYKFRKIETYGYVRPRKHQWCPANGFPCQFSPPDANKPQKIA